MTGYILQLLPPPAFLTTIPLPHCRKARDTDFCKLSI